MSRTKIIYWLNSQDHFVMIQWYYRSWRCPRRKAKERGNMIWELRFKEYFLYENKRLIVHHSIYFSVCQSVIWATSTVITNVLFKNMDPIHLYWESLQGVHLKFWIFKEANQINFMQRKFQNFCPLSQVQRFNILITQSKLGGNKNI